MRSSPSQVVRWLAYSLVALLAGSLGVGLAAPSAHSALGIGGGSDFFTGAVFPFVAGESGRVETGMYVQNTGDELVEVELSAGLPAGIELEPLVEVPLVLEPGQMSDYDFAINVSEAAPPGEYEIIATIAPTNIEREDDESGSLYIPAIAGRFFVEIVGESATVTIRPVSDATGLPALGNISLSYLDGVTGEVLMESITGTELVRDVVPGNYRATFDVQGLQKQVVEFEIGPDESRVIEMEIPTVSFQLVDAQPTRDADGGVVTADLIVAVNNSLRRIEGPVSFVATPGGVGAGLEPVTIATLAELPPGITQQRLAYRPENGFTGGEWEFVFSLQGPDFELTAADRPSFSAPGFVESNWEYIALGVLAALVVLLVLPRRWWFVLFKRRRRKDDEEQETALVGGTHAQ